MKKLTIAIAFICILAMNITTSVLAGGVGGGNANSNWTIYGWQNWSYEFIDVEDEVFSGGEDRDIQRISNNAANIGFMASVDTGMSMGGQAILANFRCETIYFS